MPMQRKVAALIAFSRSRPPFRYRLIQIYLRLWLVACTVLFSGCDRFWFDTTWRSAPYRLIEIDTRSEMSLFIDSGDGLGSRLVDRTVFSIGSDERYIVVKQHPQVGDNGFDRTITNYYVVTRVAEIASSLTEEAVDLRPAAALEIVRGPLNREQYEKLAAELSLPEFTKTFHDLE